jgi:hypothetical protein
MVELDGGTRGVYAVPYSGKTALKPIRLPSGTIVEEPTPEERARGPRAVVANLGLHPDGSPYWEGHEDLDDCHVFIGFNGLVILPDGHLAAVYGCRVTTISAGA